MTKMCSINKKKQSTIEEASDKKSQQGAALIIVLLLIAILSIITAEFLYDLRIQSLILHNHEAKIKARYVARAGQNAAEELIRSIDPESSDFNNQYVQLFRYTCLTAPMLTTLGLTTDRTDDRTDDKPDDVTQLSTMNGCGSWSLGIPYMIDETPLDLEISDEQSRINLNAIYKVQPGSDTDPDPSYLTDKKMLNVVYYLFLYQVMKNEIEIDILDLEKMVYVYLADYIDCCKVDGSFDTDLVSYFEYEDSDIIIPSKEAPLDTVDEIRYLPGMTDELFEAVKDFLTVYPVAVTPPPARRRQSNQPIQPVRPSPFTQFSKMINCNTISVEVCFAYMIGNSFTQRGDTPSIDIDDALEICDNVINASFQQGASGGAAPGQLGTGVAIPNHQRDCRPTRIPNNQILSDIQKRNWPRYYRIKSAALTEDGFETVITKVVRKNKNNTIDVLYYRED